MRHHKSIFPVMISLALTIICSMASIAAAETTIRVWVATTDVGNYLKNDYIPTFESQNPGVKVEVETLNWNTRDTKFTVAYAAGVAPDIIMTGHPSVFNEALQGMLLPIDRYISKWAESSTILPAAWANQRVSGKIYGIPYIADARGLAYRKDVFEESGLNPNAPPDSWSQILDFGKKLNRVENETVRRVGFSFRGNPPKIQDFVYAMVQTGGSIITDDLKKPAFHSSAGVTALEFIQEATQSVLPKGKLPTLGEAGIAQGSVGISYVTNYVSVRLAQLDKALLNQLVIFAPRHTPASQPITHVFMNGFAITSQTKNPDQAWSFLQGLLGREAAASFANKASVLVPRRDIVPLITNPTLPAWYRSMETMVSYQVFIGESFIKTALDGAIAQVANGELAPKTALDSVATQYQSVLNEWWDKIKR